jgi:imidazolonepropionase-like amidohydrolase
MELVRMVAWGMRPLEAMVSATANGAELLRVPDVGVIRPGAIADLVLYEGDPTADIEVTLSPARVWKAGRLGGS